MVDRDVEGAIMEVDINKIRILAESAERRAGELHTKYKHEQHLALTAAADTDFAGAHRFQKGAQSTLNDFFYWSGKATSYRGIIAMAELQQIVEDELDSEGSCP